MNDGDLASFKLLCSPSAEQMPDGNRLTALVQMGSKAITEIERLRIKFDSLTEAGTDRVCRLTIALEEVREYFDQRADISPGVDEDGTSRPNEEMKMLTEIDDALGRHGY